MIWLFNSLQTDPDFFYLLQKTKHLNIKELMWCTTRGLHSLPNTMFGFKNQFLARLSYVYWLTVVLLSSWS